jgi:hypothetical protein
MKSKLLDLVSHRMRVSFQADRPTEQQILNTLKINGPLDDQSDFNVLHWAQAALAQAGRSSYSVVGYEGYANGYFVFSVEKGTGF